MPRSLADAGFDVSLLIPKGSAAERSRYVKRIGFIADGTTSMDWIFAFAAMVKANAPRLVLPCDDTALRLLMLLAVAPPPELQPQLHIQLAALIRDSLGDTASYRASIDRTLLAAAAEALGVRVAPHRVVAGRDEAELFVGAHGFPVVVKRSESTAGDGVAVCASADELDRVLTGLFASSARDPGDSARRRVLLQTRVPGRTHSFLACAWKGELLAGFAAEQLEGEPLGPASVVRYHHSPRMRDCTTRLARGFGVTGILSPVYVVHEETGEPVLLEVRRRMAPDTHCGAAMNVDVAAALHAAMQGRPSPTRAEFDEGEEHTFAQFPAEWIRDAGSRWLRECRVDIPWDEPELFEALLDEGLWHLRQGG